MRDRLPGVVLRAISFVDGTTLELPDHGVVVIVGPNNSGKSATLREMGVRVSGLDSRALVVVQVAFDVEGTYEELMSALEKEGHLYHDAKKGITIAIPGRGRVASSNVGLLWQSGGALGPIKDLFIQELGAAERLGLSSSSPTYDTHSDPPTSPLQVLYVNPDIEERVARECEGAFGFNVCIDRVGGNTIQLHVGTAPRVGSDGRFTKEYFEEFRSLPLVEEQGDGVKSYVGIVLAVETSQQPVILIDEPEAFLHPPQARRLGEYLSNVGLSNRQVFLATHSIDVLQGVLGSPGCPTTVVRLDRRADEMSVSVIDDSTIVRLSEDPLISHSNLLDGLFHPLSVVCEGDSDCRFYGAIESAISDGPRDTHYTHCGGKDRAAVAFRILRGLHVDSRVVLDFDALSDPRLIETLVEAAGGSWMDLVADYNSAVSFMDSESRWKEVKRSGRLGLAGDTRSACDRLLSSLMGLGIFIVPVGELERWFPAENGHGKLWLADVFEKRLHEAPSDELREFVASLTTR